MNVPFDQTECATCTHEVLPGVACDGRAFLCPMYAYKCAWSPGPEARPYPYVREAAYLAQPGEFDAVRGEA